MNIINPTAFLATFTVLAQFSEDPQIIHRRLAHYAYSEPLTTFSTVLPPPSVNSTVHTSNKSIGNHYNQSNKNPQDSMRFVSISVYSIAFILGVNGNGLVIWITEFKMKKTVNTVWFLNLAIADFIFTLFLPLRIAHTALRFHWPFGTFLCKLYSTLTVLNMFASIFFLVVVSIDRCISVTKPVWSQNYRTPKLASIIAAGVWALALIVSLPNFIFRTTRPSRNGTITICYNYGSPLPQNTMISAKFVLRFLSPFFVIVVCYSIIMIKLTRTRLPPSSKPFKVILAVIVCFFLCWLPFHVFSLLHLSAYNKKRPPPRVVDVGLHISSSLASLNSCFNPILYIFMGRDFKHSVHKSIMAVLVNAFSEESSRMSNKSVNRSKLSSVAESLIA